MLPGGTETSAANPRRCWVCDGIGDCVPPFVPPVGMRIPSDSSSAVAALARRGLGQPSAKLTWSPVGQASRCGFIDAPGRAEPSRQRERRGREQIFLLECPNRVVD